MADLRRLIEIAPEAAQEARRVGSANEPRALKVRLKRSDPKVQELLGLVSELADTILIGDITVVREKLPGAEQAVLNKLQELGLPLDEFLPQVTRGASTPVAGSILSGLGFLRTFLPAVDPSLGDGIKKLEEVLLREKEKTT